MSFTDSIRAWKQAQAEKEKARWNRAKADYLSAKAIAAKAGLLLIAPDEANDFYILRAGHELRVYPPDSSGDLYQTRWRLAIDVQNEVLRPMPKRDPERPRLQYPRGGTLADIIHAVIELDDDASTIFREGYEVPAHLAPAAVDQKTCQKAGARAAGPQPAPANPASGT